MLFDKGDRLLFIGDSVTDSSRNYEAPPAGWSSWGEGYVNLINAFTTALCPQAELMIINKGVSGDRIIDLEKRWEEDVLQLKPDWVTIMIGINDVWRHFDSVFSQDEQVSKEMFREKYASLIEKTQKKTKGILLLSTFMVESYREDPMRKMTDEYNQITKESADHYGLKYIDVQKYFDDFLIHQSSYVLSSDRVHPSLAGHLLISKAWMNSTEFL